LAVDQVQVRSHKSKVYRMKALLNGRWIDAKDVLEIMDPYTGDLVGTVPRLSTDQVCKAIEATPKHPSSLSGWERYQILRNTADEVYGRAEEFANLISREAGITWKTSRHEVDRAYQVLLLSAEEAKRITGETLPADIVPGIHAWVAITLREPVGIVSAITPFNHPLNQIVHKLGPAIAANNRVILKPSGRAPLTALLFGEVLLKNGLPPDMLSIITGNVDEFGDLLVSHPRIRMVSFTGSVPVGEMITKKTGVKRVCLELGGNNALIVMEDAHINQSVTAAVKGSFDNAGQRCTSINRILLHSAVADTFIERFLSAVTVLKYGDPMDSDNDIGTLIDEDSAVAVERLVQTAISEGAKLLCGGRRYGALMTPTVVDYVKPSSRLASIEIFGPVAPIIRIESPEEALAIANSTTYGLQAGVFTQDLSTALYFARNLEVGGVVINEAPSFRIEYLPFGGVKMSGVGREGIRYAVQSMTEVKTVFINTGK